MKSKELRNLSKQELLHLLREEKEKLRHLRFDIALKKIKDVRQIRKIRKDIARILTVIRKNLNNK